MVEIKRLFAAVEKQGGMLPVVYKVQWHFSHLLSTLSVEPQLKANLQNHKKYQSFCLSSSPTNLPSSPFPPIHPLSLLPHQQNQRMMTPSAASDTVSSPPCSGYIHSQKPLMVCMWSKGGVGGGICYKSRLTKSHSPHNMTKTYAGFISSPSSAPSPWEK